MLGKEPLEIEIVKRAQRLQVHPTSVFFHRLREDSFGMEVHDSGLDDEVS